MESFVYCAISKQRIGMGTKGILLFIYEKCLLSTYKMSGTILDIWDTSVNKIDKDSCPHGSMF